MAVEKSLTIGLGDALERLIQLHDRVIMGIATPEDREERKVLLGALNAVPVDLSASCDIEPPPTADGVGLLTETARTSCCRISHARGGRVSRPSGQERVASATEPGKNSSKTDGSTRTRKRRGSSRIT